MAVFQYVASSSAREDHVESGTIVASSEAEAKVKLKEYHFDNIKTKKLGGISGIFRRFTADIK